MIFHSLKNPGKGELETPDTFDEALWEEGGRRGEEGGEMSQRKDFG